MSTIRKSASDTIVDLLGTIGTIADAATSTTNIIGRTAQAGEAYVDAWATDVELNAAERKNAAGRMAKHNAAMWLTEQQIEIEEQLDTDEKRSRFNANLKLLYPEG